VNLKVEDYYPSGKRFLLRFKEKGGEFPSTADRTWLARDAQLSRPFQLLEGGAIEAT
jgi:hypothetical protein